MSVNTEIKTSAKEILDAFTTISAKAREEGVGGGVVFHGGNAFVDGSRGVTLITDTNGLLSREPALARVIVEDEDRNRRTYYFCRSGPGPSSLPFPLASLKAPVGSLASRNVGEKFVLPRGKSVTVLQNARFTPKIVNQEWDTHKAEIRGEGYAKTIESLRGVLSQIGVGTIDEDRLEALLSEESESENIADGIRRSVIERMDLRDQPILDQYQDKIFRLPLDSQLMILGAPGTGKTTTLIRRLGQKVAVIQDLMAKESSDFIEDDEEHLRSLLNSEIDHARNWIMFTPTELLKLYVKEAFSRENVPASDERISTWADFRENLARNEFPVLKSAANKGRLFMKDTAAALTPEAEADLIGLFEDFDQWQKAEFWKELQADAERLSENPASEIAAIGQKILSEIKDVNDKTAPATFSSLAALTETIKEVADAKKEDADKKIKEVLQLQLNRNRTFRDELGGFIDSLSDTDEDADDQDVDDEDEINTLPINRSSPLTRYISASKSYARARAQGKQVSKTSSTGRIIEWLGDRIISEDVAKEIGKSLIVQSALRRFAKPVRGYIDKIPARYRRYRRAKQAEGHWYRGEGFAPTDVHPLEVDIILLAALRNSDSLIAGIRTPDDETRKTLDRLQNLYYTQVLVDEATDFSPVQLACMIALSRPRIRSFFACGDFNQRFTSYGVRSIEQVKWAVQNIKVENISIAYRQSDQMHRLAQGIIGLSSDNAGDVPSLEEYTDNEGFAPVVALGMSDDKDSAAWLAARIKEIERAVHKLPSIAVLVNNEDAVRSVAEALKIAVEDQNIKVIPCYNGQVLGHDNGAAVRVFNVQHIKGLEFEAVFFVGIDKLAESHPSLFEKYLYVGATRAATYFGMTCEKDFPVKLAPIRNIFRDAWSY